jgi:hypothetical protein
MAVVRVSIPGIGDVVAENAASEDTLLKILAVMEKNAAATSKKDSPENKKAIDAKNKESKASQDASKGLDQLAKKGDEAAKSQTKTAKFLSESWGNVKTGVATAATSVIGFGKQLLQTAASVAAQFATSYEQMSKDPIGAAAGLLNTGIDLMAGGAKAAVDAIGGLTKGLTGAIPLIGPAIGGMVDGLSAAAKAAIDLAATLAKTANDIMAAEFKKSVAQLKEYTAAGASFAGGMMEMRDVAHRSGLSIETLGAAAKASREDFRAMGLTQGEGVKKLAAGMDAAQRTIGRSGKNVRDELLALGYSYEEQGAIMAQYMAQQKASGQLEKMTTEQIAKGTAEYAKNLKVISDITGQDAKKLMEKARAESMRGALMGKLDADQQKAFKDAHATLMSLGPEMGPKLQTALMQMLAGGTVTDPVIAGNKEAMAMLKKTAEGVKAGNQDMVKNTQQAIGEAAEQSRKSGETATDTAALFSNAVSPVTQGLSTLGNALKAYQLDPDAAAKSTEAAEKQRASTDEVTTGFARVTKATNDFAVRMESLASKNLGAYADLLATTMEKVTQAFMKGIDIITGKVKLEDLTKIDNNKVDIEKVKKEDARNEKLLKGFSEKFQHYTAKGIETTGEALASGFKKLGMETIGGWLTGSSEQAKVDRVKNETEYLKKQGRIKMARGGIVEGPMSGFMAELHGTEAVIPLEGNRGIPVDMSGFAESIGKIDFSKQQLAQPKMPELTSFMPKVEMPKPATEDFSKSVTEQFEKMMTVFTTDKEKKSAEVDKKTSLMPSQSDQLMQEVRDLLLSQLSKHDEMISQLRSSTDISQRILNNSYS